MPEKWDQVKELFTLALERDPEDRGSFLRQACAGDDSLRTEIESLLSSFDGSATFLEDCPAANLLSAQSGAMAGRRIGAYRTIREIGHGGMGVVYLGERDDQIYRKQVAIKMVKPGIDTEQILHRFRNERQTLAALDHSNIVKLLDGGNGEDGSPYLVMEYVDGLPIDQYCDLNKLSIDDRLRLFREVCSAVQYAHEKLVIHRDLKPGNILIAKGGVPRLLDFGIAKLLNPECYQTPPVTRTNWRPMTPEYASPEQIRGHAVTAATDVYSLGVLLFELLTGRRPYRSTGRSLLEMERLVCESEPERPSAVIYRKEEKASSEGEPPTPITADWVSNQRRLRPAELQRRLCGDLDTIVMKALRKEPDRRYGSVEEFSRDVDRCLTGMPVTARKPTIAYRSGRFAHRHTESLAAVLVALGIVASIAAWEVHRVSRQSATALEAKNPERRTRRSVAILGFKNLSDRPDTRWVSIALSEMLAAELAAGEKLRTIPGETVARMKIDLGLPDMESLAPQVLGPVRKNLGSDFVVVGSYFDLGKDSGGRIRLDLVLQDTASGKTLPVSETSTEAQLLDLVSRVGRKLRQDLGVAEVSQVESVGVRASIPSNPDAMRLYSEGLAKLRAFNALAARDLLTHAVSLDPAYPLAHAELANAWMALGYNSIALQEAKKALELSGKLASADHSLVEARYYEVSKDWDKAIETYRTLSNSSPDSVEYGLYLANAQIDGERGRDAVNSIARLRGLSAEEDPRIDLAEVRADYSLSDNKGVVASADLAIKKASQLGAGLLIARARVFQCRALSSLGQPKQATAACEESRRIFHEAGDLAGESQALHAMAEVPINQGDLEQARTLYEQALTLARQIGDKKATGRELGNIGLIYIQEGDLTSGKRIYEEALEAFRDIGDKHGMSVVTGNTGDILHAEGRLGDALAEYKDALVLAREVGHRSSEAIDIQLMGDVLADQGDLQGAMQMYQQAVSIQREIDDRSYYAASLMSIGKLRRQKADKDGAKKIYEEALSLRRQLGEKGTAAETQLALGELDCDTGQPSEAESLAREAIQEFQLEREVDREIQSEALLSRSLLQQGKLEGAQNAITRALRLSDKSSDVTVRLPLAIQNAYTRVAAKDLPEAELLARNVLVEANKLGFVRIELEASLAIGEIQMKGKNPNLGRKWLEETETTARSKGFELIARRASAARQATKHIAFAPTTRAPGECNAIISRPHCPGEGLIDCFPGNPGRPTSWPSRWSSGLDSLQSPWPLLRHV
jgi:serine/threonine protein kinase/tetratricopeptide (TPR) repeat protein